jgi:hypothetical protein
MCFPTCIFKLHKGYITLKEHSFNTILESEQCCKEPRCQRRKKELFYGVQNDLCICRINGRVASFQLGSRATSLTANNYPTHLVVPIMIEHTTPSHGHTKKTIARLLGKIHLLPTEVLCFMKGRHATLERKETNVTLRNIFVYLSYEFTLAAYVLHAYFMLEQPL